jgi:hypothetical protein
MTWTYTDGISYVGAPIDYQVFDEIQSNVNLLNAAIGPIGSSTFAGPTGQAITIADQGSTAYHVTITPSADPGGYLGEVWVAINSATQFTVYNSGSAVTAFKYKVSK